MVWFMRTRQPTLTCSESVNRCCRACLNLENVVWNFRALRDPVPTRCIANGSITSTRGLIALLDNESQLAAILAHEMTHVLNRHTYLQNRSIRKKFSDH